MVIKIGHRGCAYEPENTLKSFEKALALGAEMVEFDLRLTKDKQLVVIHDDKLDRTTNGRGKVADYTLKELKKLDAGKKEKIPTLKEVFSRLNQRCQLNIEVKEPESVDLLLNFLDGKIKKEKRKNFKNFLVSSGSVPVLLKIKKNIPKVKTAFLVCQSRGAWETRLCVIINKIFFFLLKHKILNDAKSAKTEIVCLNKHLVNKRSARFFHQNNLQLFVWTVNKKKEIEKFKRLKVAGIFSDFPELI